MGTESDDGGGVGGRMRIMIQTTVANRAVDPGVKRPRGEDGTKEMQTTLTDYLKILEGSVGIGTVRPEGGEARSDAAATTAITMEDSDVEQPVLASLREIEVTQHPNILESCS